MQQRGRTSRPPRRSPALPPRERVGHTSRVRHRAADPLGVLGTDTSDLAAVLDHAGRLVHLNPAGRQLLKLGPTELPTDLASACAADLADRVRAEVLPALRSGAVWRGPLTLLAADGSQPHVRAVIRPHPARRGRPWQATLLARDVTTEKAMAAQLAHRAFHDELTGLPHRSLFLDRLYVTLARPEGESRPAAVLFLNLDRFKERNDIHGHAAGDRLLAEVAGRLREALDPAAVLARFGGDEFAILREDVAGEEDAITLAAAVLDALARPFEVGEHEAYLTASVGIAVGAAGGVRPDELLRNADAAMQQAKLHGGNGFQLFDDTMRLRTRRRVEIDAALRRALDRGELAVHYQPEFSLADGSVRGVEALVRWHHPEWGLVSPAEFIPVAESTGSITALGAWVMGEAFEQAARWRATREGPFLVAVNLSARQFAQDDVVELVAGSLAATGARPSDVCLELTESTLMEDLERALATLVDLKSLGVRLAVDDFGTGYSSLAYLKRFPVDILKVDQSFVRGLGHNDEDSALVGAVVAMAKALGLTTLAEGVETDRHVEELVGLGCDLAQGYYFGRPQAACDLDLAVLDLRAVSQV